MVKALRILLVLLGVTLIAPGFYGQEDESVMALTCGKKGLADKFGRKMDGVTISIKKDGSSFKTVTTGSNGKYEKVIMPYGSVYEVTISKAGYVTKKILIDGKKGYFPEDIMEKETAIECKPEMVPKQAGVDYSVITKSPVAKARIDPATGSMNYDMGFIGKRNNEIQKFLDGLAAEDEAADKKFNQLMEAGNKSFGSADYDKALQNFKAAKEIKPDNEEVDSKIADTENKIEEMKAEAEMLAKFNEKIKEGDQLVAAGKFDDGIKKYQAAKSIKTGDPLPDKKIAEAEKLKADAEKNAIDQQYAAKMKEASTAFGGKDYQKARGLYDEASKIKPAEKEPKNKIEEIDGILANLAKYDALIKDADAKFAAKEWESSKSKYQEALNLIKEKHPADQIARIDAELKKLQEEQAKRDEYDQLIAKADGEFGAEKWESAKANYEAAIKLFNESHPNDQLAKIAEKMKAAEEEKKKQQEYDQLIAKAQSHYKNNELEDAKTAYTGAKNIKPDPGIDAKIAEIDQKIKDEKDAAAAAAVEKAKRDQYDQLMSKASGQFNAKDWEAAKATYNEALKLYDEKEPKDQIAKIDIEIKKEKDAAEAAAAEKQKRDQYDQLMAKAKEEFDSRDWEAARKSYNEALKLYNEQPPKDGLAAIDAEIQKEKDAAAADAAEKAKMEQYDQLMAKAKGQFDSKDWEGARKSYNDALKLYDKQEPKDGISAIDAAIQAEKDQAAADAAAAKILADYNAKVKEADAARDKAKDGPGINAAISLYKEANAIKNDEQYPADEVAKLQSRLDELEGAQKAYDKLIAVADKKFSEGDYEKSKELFNRAKGMRPNDTYPPQQLAAIEQKIKELKDQEAADAAEAAKRAKYEEFIRTGNGAFDSKTWDAAKTAYNEALKLYSDEQYPKDQLAAIDKAIQEEKDRAANDAAAAAKILADYKAKIKEADAARDAASDGPGVNQAISLYKEANAIKNDETYPAEEVAKLQERLGKMESAKAAYDKLIAVADKKRDAEDYTKALELYNRAKGMRPDDSYPPAEIAKIEQLLKDKDANAALMARYNAKIAEADAARDKADDGNMIQSAINLYKEANKIKNDETYPAEQVALLQDRLNKINDGAAAYQKLIAVADKKFDSEDYDKAKELYIRAKGMKPGDSYPPDQIRKINDILKGLKDKDATTAQFQEIIQKADAAFAEEKYTQALKDYNRALGVIPGSAYPTRQIDKIKDILDQLAADKANEAFEEKRKEVLDASEFYGEDITGQYSDDELDAVFKEDQVTHNAWRDDELEQIKTSEYELNEELTEHSRELSDENFQIYEEYKQKLSDEKVDRDIPRQRVVDEVETYRDTHEEQQEEDKLRFDNRTYDTYEEGRAFEERTAEENAETIKSRDINAEAYEKYKDDLSTWDDLEEEGAISRTEQKYADNETYRTNRTEEKEASIDRRDLTSEKHADDKVKVSEWNEALQLDDAEKDYQQHQYTEEVKSNLQEFYDEGDDRREDFVVEMEEYKDKERDQQAASGIQNRDRTYETHEQIEEDITERAEFEASLDEPRLKYAEEYETYKDELSEWSEEIDGDGVDKTYNQHVEVENYKTRVTDEFKDADIQRQKNVDAVERTNDQLANLGVDEQQEGEDRTYSQHLAQEDFATKVSDLLADADIPRQKTVDEVTEYQDKMYDSEAEKKQDLEDVFDDRRKVYEENDNLSDQMFSEENSNDLAREYGPGVHEKVYQRKDKRGNIMQVTVVRVVVIGTKGHEYKMIKTRFAEQYFKDGKPISESIWDTETTLASE